MDILKKVGWRRESLPSIDPIVSITVDDSGTPFKIHKHVLYEECDGLRDYLDTLTGQDMPLVLNHVSAECFETVSQWLYAKKLMVKELENYDIGVPHHNDRKGCDGSSTYATDVGKSTQKLSAKNGHDQADQEYIHVEVESNSGLTNLFLTKVSWYNNLDRTGRVYARLVDLYAFATKYEARRLRRVIMLAWQRFSISCNSLPPGPVVSRAFSQMNGDEPLCKYIILWYGYFNGNISFDAAEFGSISPKFLAGVLEIMYQKQAGGYHFVGLDNNWCDFHEHTDEVESADCQKAREKDPDVVLKRTEELWNGISPAWRY